MLKKEWICVKEKKKKTKPKTLKKGREKRE